MATDIRWPRASGATLIGAIAAGSIALLTSCSSQQVSSVPTVQLMTRVSEADFQRSIPSSDLDNGEREGEWRAARSDHHVIANAILACKDRFEEIASMSPSVFSALLLDLTPKGSHILSAVAPPVADKGIQTSRGSDRDSDGFVRTAAAAQGGSEDAAQKSENQQAAKTGATESNRDKIALTATEWYLLATSDSIARMRLMAVTARADAFDPAKKIWVWTLLIGGLATFFVTLQAKMSPPAAPAGAAATANAAAPAGAAAPAASPPPVASGWQWLGVRLPHHFRRFLYQFVIIGAIALSITSTSLNALKQYFDPTRALVQNELAMMDLRKLHQSVIQAASCNNGAMTIADEIKNRTDWATRVQTAVSRIVSPYSTAAASGGARDTP
jgi:hypothetical protein